ncbi:HTH domain-containing protein [Ottowia sp.]|uniref:HTH domain-containing protein n=1 Tax=Ottowia sp. TaxID=1898956 RepID=UPI00261C1FEC|nr:HTH domain-containing protein [Ottowia sp.]
MAILMLLQTQGRATAPALAERLEVSVRATWKRCRPPAYRSTPIGAEPAAGG